MSAASEMKRHNNRRLHYIINLNGWRRGEDGKNMNEVSFYMKSNRKRYLRGFAAKWAEQLVTWIGCIIVGLLVIPAGILIALILAVRSASDKIVVWIDKKQG